VRCLAAAVLAIAVMPMLAGAAEECGPAASPCAIVGGEYHIALPGNWSGGPAVIHLHGYGGSGAKVISNTDFVQGFLDRGYALIAPTGLPWEPGSPNDWSVCDGWTYDRDDIAFLSAVLEDASARFAVDRARVLLTGFSRGGSMVWDTACHGPGTARAYAPVAGAFWEPRPEGCQGAVDLFHTHGWTDRVVPLEGRSVGQNQFTQGDAFTSLVILRETLGCDPHMPDVTKVEGDLWLRSWEKCPMGRIDLMLHPGGHSIPPGWTARALDWFEARLAED
jgi:polyhydroxybutyrate depolymerase